jgi:hypothetical protein
VLTGEEGARRIDPSGRSHGLLARIWRSIQFATMDALPDAGRYAAAAQEGRFVLAVRAEDEARRAKLVEILERHGGHFINYYGKLTTTELRP